MRKKTRLEKIVEAEFYSGRNPKTFQSRVRKHYFPGSKPSPKKVKLALASLLELLDQEDREFIAVINKKNGGFEHGKKKINTGGHSGAKPG